ncbi:MAG TPA: hypothetical protein VFP89_06510 [Propionibacteriaceae bacterium]|nr:hypothetical protein [Propionibacteriaceae bacterium]
MTDVFFADRDGLVSPGGFEGEARLELTEEPSPCLAQVVCGIVGLVSNAMYDIRPLPSVSPYEEPRRLLDQPP